MQAPTHENNIEVSISGKVGTTHVETMYRSIQRRLKATSSDRLHAEWGQLQGGGPDDTLLSREMQSAQ